MLIVRTRLLLSLECDLTDCGRTSLARLGIGFLAVVVMLIVLFRMSLLGCGDLLYFNNK